MDKAQVTDLLVRSSALSGRDFDRLHVETWHEVIGHLDYEDAKAALVDYYRTERYPIVPAEIVERASARKQVRLQARRDSLLEAQRRELANALNDRYSSDSHGELSARMFEFAGPQDDVNGARALLARHRREMAAVDEDIRAQIEAVNQ